MRRIDDMGWLHALLLVGLWRGASELMGRRRALRDAGLLDVRIAAARAARIDRALGRLGLPPARQRVLAAVHVGGVPERDVDDVALLEGSMRRATRAGAGAARPAATAGRVAGVPGLPPRPATDWGRLIEEAREQPRARDARASHGAVPAWANLLAAVGVVLTLAALLRPLADGAPWLALAGVVLALAGLVAARRG